MEMIPVWLAIISVASLAAISRQTRINLGSWDNKTQAVMSIAVTIAVLIAGLYVILDHSYLADDKKWGYGIVGTVVGFWLKK